MRGGHVDAITRRTVAGWAADSSRPDERLIVTVLVNGARVGETAADRLRKDLANLGRYGDGKHGFLFEYPAPLDPDGDHLVTVVFAEDGARLPNGEHRLSAAGAAPMVAGPAASAGTIAAGPAAGAAMPVETMPAGRGPAEKGPAATMPAGMVALDAASAAGPGAVRGAAEVGTAREGAPAKSRRRKAAAAAADGLLPVMVTAPGRSGTTLLMGLLAKSPAIVASELVPYELRLLSYYSAACHVLTAPADLEKSTHPDRLEGDGFHIGFNPFHGVQYAAAFRDKAALGEYYDSVAPGRVLAMARDLVREYYTRLARDKGKDGARYFAEKGNNLHAPTREFTRRAFGRIRELVIVRDPRDVLCSHMAYFSSSPEKAFGQLSHAARQLLAIRAEDRADIHMFRYEDMVRGDAACFAALSAFLDTPIEPEGGTRPAEVFRRHGTSVSPEASVARWRFNLPEALQDRCRADWGGFLGTFGYDLE